MSFPIYLDHNATSPCSPEAAARMAPYHTEIFGNSLTNHEYGRPARAALEEARAQVAALLGCENDEVVFTGGGTEALNYAVKGLAFAALKGGPRHIILSATEHHAVEDSVHWLGQLGFTWTTLRVDHNGQVDPDELRRELDTRDTLLVAVMHANNEVGTLQPVEVIGALCQERGVPFLCDEVQSAGKISIQVNHTHADLAALAGHKLYGPKGVGALYIRRGLHLENLLHGAGHESGRRAGTHNVPGAVGFGVAATQALHTLELGEEQRQATLRNELEARLQDYFPGAQVNGGGAPRLPNTSNMSFPGILAQDLLSALGTRHVAASAGAACRDGVPTPSPTLLAMGLGPERALGGIRMSIGRSTTPEILDEACKRIMDALSSLR